MRIRFLIFALAAVFTLQGCDWVKKQLGMPTSADLERAKQEMELAEQQRIADSVRAAAAADSIRLAEAAAEKMPYASELNNRFFVILGSYKKDYNAEAMYDNLKKEGYSPVRIAFKNGYDVVAACGADSYGEALREMEKISYNDLCPYDVWIYDAALNLHEQ